MIWKIAALGGVVNYTTGWALHYVYLPERAEAHHATSAKGVGGAQSAAEHVAGSTHSAGSAGAVHSAAEHAAGVAHSADAAQHLSPLLHFVRDSTLALPATIGVLLLAALAVRALTQQTDTAVARVGFAVGAAVAVAGVSVPEVLVHGWLFGEQFVGSSQLAGVALVSLRYTFALSLIAAVLFGVPWRAPRSTARSIGLPIHGEA